MKRLTLVMIAALLVFTSFAVVQAPAKAAPAQQGVMNAQVWASQLYIRTSPKITAGVLGVTNWGEYVSVLGRNARGNWAKIVARNGTVGWVSIYWIHLQYNVAYASLPVVG